MENDYTEIQTLEYEENSAPPADSKGKYKMRVLTIKFWIPKESAKKVLAGERNVMRKKRF